MVFSEMIVFTLLFLQQKINFKISDYLYFTVINHKPWLLGIVEA